MGRPDSSHIDLFHDENMHNAHHSVKSKRTPTLCFMHVMKSDDRPDFAKRLEQARVDRGFTTAKEAARYFGWKYETYIQHEQGIRGIARAAGRYAKAFRVSEGWLLTGEGKATPETVPLKGKVGAGQQIEAIDNGDLDDVLAPPDAAPETVAVQVSGDSMFPTYEEGSILYYSRRLPPYELVNQRAIVQLADGRIFLKIIRQGSTPDTWTLQSINAQYTDIIDVSVDWAAPIDWIKPR